MKYAFIDYENLNSLDGLQLQNYERIYLFLGASNNQKAIHLTEKFDDEINIRLITVKDVSKNNADFHIAYFIGKLDATVDKAIEFYILSKDQGYDGLCRFVREQKEKRICCRETKNIPAPKLLDPPKNENENEKIDQIIKQYVPYIKSKAPKKRPTKIISLSNDIRSRCKTALKGSNENNIIEKIIEKLEGNKIIKTKDSRVTF